MKLAVVFSAEARHDLQAILSYVAEDSPRLAVGLVDRLENAALELAMTSLHFPVAFAGTHIRRKVVGSYNIYYRVGQDSIDVYRILHGARTQQRLLFGDD